MMTHIIQRPIKRYMKRKITGFPYYIDSKGIVFSYRKNTPLSTTWDKGYLTVSLRLKGKNYRKFVNQLMAKTYKTNEKNHKYVMHSNGKRDDNGINNVEWVSGAHKERKKRVNKYIEGVKKFKIPDKFKNPKYA